LIGFKAARGQHYNLRFEIVEVCGAKTMELDTLKMWKGKKRRKKKEATTIMFATAKFARRYLKGGI